MFITKNYYHITNEKFYFKIIEKLELSKDTCIIFLIGSVGAGKTTFVKAFLSYIGATNGVTSPTFTIVNEYLFNCKKIYHYDFYRLKNKSELFEIGIDYYLDQPGIHFVEWPDDFLNYLPQPSINISFMILSESRLIKIEYND
mgnify:FL=1|tara:strand:- start:785 stop:1213 length:429 start_codon:yes stop_codon:yes gene_type:complete